MQCVDYVLSSAFHRGVQYLVFKSPEGTARRGESKAVEIREVFPEQQSQNTGHPSTQ